MEDLAVSLRRFAREQGADLVGITPAERLDAALSPGYRASFCGRCLSVCPLGRAAAKRRGNL
jgi:hypothetical protein